MKFFWFALLSALIYPACSSDQSDSQNDHAEKPDARDSSIDPFPSDPYFIETRDTFSAKGPDNITRDILQDKNGIFWMGSWEGLYCYKDSIFTNITLQQGLSHHRIFSLLESKDSTLWFGSLGAGVYHYDDSSFKNFSERDGLINNFVECIFEDTDGNTWFGTDGGVSRYDGNLFLNIDEGDGLTGVVHTIAQDKNGVMWFGTDDGVFRYIGFEAVPFMTTNKSRFVNVRSLLCDSKGVMWIGCAEGLYKCTIDADGATTQTRMLANFTSYVREERNGNLLLSAGIMSVTASSGMALYQYDGTRTVTLTEKIDNNDSQVFGSMEDKQGNIWFGSMQGICRYDGNEIKCFAH